MPSKSLPLVVTTVLLAMGPISGSSLDGHGLIHIGSRKQLLLDDQIIELTSDVKRVLNTAVKAPGNPVLRADRPWESNYLRCNYVTFDPKDDLFKMWYTSYNEFKPKKGGDGNGYRTQWEAKGDGFARHRVPDPYDYYGDPNGDMHRLCYATSRDGIRWEKPNLGKVEFRGSRANNILPEGSRSPYMLDLHETDPSRRYKTAGDDFKYMAYHDRRINLYYSSDGIEWSPAPTNIEGPSSREGRWGPTTLNGWDPIRGVYAAHIESCLHRRCPLGKRIVGRAESPDMVTWSEVQTIMIPDDRDPPDLEFYAFPVFAYEGIYIAVPWIFRTTESLHYPQLAFSRDGIHYRRPFREPIVKLGDAGDFDETTLYMKNPFFHEGRILFYYSGGNWRGPEPLYDIGEKANFSIGLATLPEDGFVSILAGKLRPGKVLTKVFTFEGDGLFVSMEGAKHNWGSGPTEVKVEIVDSAHDPIPGFTLAEADNLTTSGKHRVTWKGQGDVGRLTGKPVQLRFRIRNAKLNSFQFK